MASNNQIVISRIQNRRGIRENLPQPLLAGEFALTVDTGELWIGTDPNQPPFGVRTYGTGPGDISSAENIVDNQVVSAKFAANITGADFENIVDYLTNLVTLPNPNVVLTSADILWDERDTIFISADTSVDVANTISNIFLAVENSMVAALVYDWATEVDTNTAYVALGAINDPSVDPSTTSAFDLTDGDFLFTAGGSNAEQGANAATLINQIHGAQLVTTLSNLQVTTTGIGVGSSTFRDWTVINDEATLPFTPEWQETGTATADSVTDKMYIVAGEGIKVELNDEAGDPSDLNDAIRITNTYADVATNEFTLNASQPTFTNVTGLTFDIDAVSDVIFLDYSLNIAGAVAGDNNYTAGGQMSVVGNNLVGSGSATLADAQVEVRDEVGDAFQANVQLCAPFEGLDGATTYTEASQRLNAATFQGGAEIDTAQFKFGTSSALFDGVAGTGAATGTGIAFGDGAGDWAAWQLTGTSDMTLEAFVRFTSLPTSGNQMMVASHSFTDATNFRLEFHNNAGTYQVRAKTGGVTRAGNITTPTLGVWYHVATQIRGSGTTQDVFFDGNRVATGSPGTPQTMTDPIHIGAYDNTLNANYSRVMDGHIDGVRYTVGTARYGTGATYTVPTAPLCAAPAPVSGDINFQAAYVPGSPNLIQIQYTNTFVDAALMRVVRKRWMSF